jgi:peptide/nickel transport system substrate-binding protein
MLWPMNVGRASFALALSGALFASLCGGEPRVARAGEAHVLRFTAELDVTTLDPLLSNVAITTDLAQLTMAHFVRIDAENRIVPELLTVLPTTSNGGISSDGRTVTYHLRHGVRWSDGAPFDSSDVVFTVKTILNPNNNITVRDAWDRVSGVEAPDPYTVKLHLKAPYGSFLSRYFSSSDTSCILPKHILAGEATINQAPYNALPVGIGPFRYTAFRRGDAIEMEANPYYFGGRPKLQKIVYKIITDENTALAELQTGEIDLWSTVGGSFYERVRALPGVRSPIVPSQFMAGAYFNTSRPVLRDPNVRRALVLAADRAFILAKINHGAGTLAQSVVAPISQDFTNLPRTPYDPAAAARLLDASGWKLGSDGVRSKNGTQLAIQLALPNGYLPSQITAEFLRSAWAKLGAAVETKTYADAQYFAPSSAGGILTSGTFDVALLSQQGGYDADVSFLYGCAYVPPRGNNLVRFCDPNVDADMSAYVGTIDERKRAELAARFQRDIDRAAPALILYERGFIFAYSNRVHGFHPGGFTDYDEMMNVDVDP